MRSVRLNILITTVILICVGIIMIYSASSIYALERYKDSMFFLKRHLTFVLIGGIATFFIMGVDYRVLKKYARPMLMFSVILLLLVLFPGIGREVAGAKRWFRFGPVSFQPSELMNLVLIIYVADFISRKKNVIGTFWEGFVPVILVLGTVILLILAQPDLGTAVSLGLVIFIMLFLAGTKLKYLAGVFLASLPLLYILIFSVPYRKARIMTFLNPWLDPKGSGFQIIQSNIALGSGGIFGIGLGHSRQKLFYLPASYTDFIFSIIGEELGLLGTLVICLLFINLFLKGMKVSRNAADGFGHFLSLGIILIISLKALINIGVSSGFFPTKGLPLPFISYGGSSLVFDMVGIGLLLNISRIGEYP